MPRLLKNSTRPSRLPTRHRMSAISSDEGGQQAPSRRPRLSDTTSALSPGSWLFGGPSQQAAELAELRERLQAAEQRAEAAEEALPHLLALGQRTVNGLLSDARARGREIIEQARAEARRETEREREALQRESRELDALRMAVAAEAMGLEQVRRELDAAVAEAQLESGPITGRLGAGDDHRAAQLPPPPTSADLDAVGMTPQRSSPESPSRRFAEAWAEGEDEMMAEAFDRFFQAEIERDPQRDAALDLDSLD